MTSQPSAALTNVHQTPQRASTAIIIAGRVSVPPEDVETFVAEAKATYPIAAANPGNRFISFCLEDAAAGSVTVLEQWASREDLDAHLSTPEVVALFTKWSSVMNNEVRAFDAANERDPRT